MLSHLRLVRGIDVDALSESDRRELVAVSRVYAQKGWAL